jgi:hypothetical protein
MKFLAARYLKTKFLQSTIDTKFLQSTIDSKFQKLQQTFLGLSYSYKCSGVLIQANLMKKVKIRSLKKASQIWQNFQWL